MMGVVQSLISIFAEDDDRPRSIIRGQTQITFVLKPQLYLFAVSDWGEPEYVVSTTDRLGSTSSDTTCSSACTSSTFTSRFCLS